METKLTSYCVRIEDINPKREGQIEWCAGSLTVNYSEYKTIWMFTNNRHHDFVKAWSKLFDIDWKVETIGLFNTLEESNAKRFPASYDCQIHHKEVKFRSVAASLRLITTQPHYEFYPKSYGLFGISEPSYGLSLAGKYSQEFDDTRRDIELELQKLSLPFESIMDAGNNFGGRRRIPQLSSHISTVYFLHLLG